MGLNTNTSDRLPSRIPAFVKEIYKDTDIPFDGDELQPDSGIRYRAMVPIVSNKYFRTALSAPGFTVPVIESSNFDKNTWTSTGTGPEAFVEGAVNFGITFKNIRCINSAGPTGRKPVNIIGASRNDGALALDNALFQNFAVGGRMENTILRMDNNSVISDSGALEMLAMDMRLFDSFHVNFVSTNLPLLDIKNSVTFPTINSILISNRFEYSSQSGESFAKIADDILASSRFDITNTIPDSFTPLLGVFFEPTGLDQKDIKVNAFNNKTTANQCAPDSRTSAEGVTNTSTLNDDVINGTYNALKVSGFIADDSTEGLELLDASQSIWKYIRLAPFVGNYLVTLSGLKAAATANYRFANSINGKLPVFTGITTTAISSVTDNGGQAVFNHSGTDPFVGQEVVIAGYIVNTDYNGNFIVTASAVGTFEVGVAFGTDEAIGGFSSDVSPYTPMEVKTTKVSVTISLPVSLVTGDIIQLMKAGDGTGDDFTLTDMSQSLK